MLKTQNTFGKRYQRLWCLVAVLLVCGMTLRAAPARAQVCETPGAAAIAAAPVAAFAAARIAQATFDILDHINSELADTTDLFEDTVSTMKEDILDHMNAIWTEWDLTTHEMAAQLTAGTVEHSRQFSSMFDSANMTSNARDIQRDEIEARKKHRTNDEACVFDSTTETITRVSQLSTAVTRGLVSDANEENFVKAGSPQAAGQNAYVEDRMARHRAMFCDPTSNAGNAGCVAVLPLANADVMPSKTIFGELTLDLADPDKREAIHALAANITGYQPPAPIPLEALEQTSGQEARIKNRKQLARMDVVNALIYSVVGDRAPSGDPGVPASTSPEIQAIRQNVGVTTASLTPSSREVRQAVLEQIQDPNYYIDLVDSPGTIAQKELYLRAYNLMLFYKVLEKTERIALGYAVETASMLANRLDNKTNRNLGTAGTR